MRGPAATRRMQEVLPSNTLVAFGGMHSTAVLWWEVPPSKEHNLIHTWGRINAGGSAGQGCRCFP
jgi:hypothetical protein